MVESTIEESTSAFIQRMNRMSGLTLPEVRNLYYVLCGKRVKQQKCFPLFYIQKSITINRGFQNLYFFVSGHCMGCLVSGFEKTHAEVLFLIGLEKTHAEVLLLISFTICLRVISIE